ncbi:hypothetical protein N7493_009458 [Penicillium malachiteum]|uniref:Uncharacterized protein n=1 Tax=Penicillium malachiteum TaxID=1324776 RepID=A0AAD6MSE8_9EURO|nr:hypothetical protein N7493_009458 [Penicillium malachiteum]
MSDKSTDLQFNLAQALADLSKGETTATALENHLDDLESKIDKFLAAFEEGNATQETSPEDQDSKNAEGDHKAEKSG